MNINDNTEQWAIAGGIPYLQKIDNYEYWDDEPTEIETDQESDDTIPIKNNSIDNFYWDEEQDGEF